MSYKYRTIMFKINHANNIGSEKYKKLEIMSTRKRCDCDGRSCPYLNVNQTRGEEYGPICMCDLFGVAVDSDDNLHFTKRCKKCIKQEIKE